MATANTREVKAFLARLPEALRTNVLRGAARAGAKVVADEAKELCISDDVRSSIRIASTEQGMKLLGKVQCRGKGAFMAPWLEYGTAKHIIRFKGDAPAGRSLPSVARWNSLGRQFGVYEGQRPGSLRIGDKWVGNAVIHPGAKRHPFMRPALDMKAMEAIAAAQAYINKRLTKAGLFEADPGIGGDE